MRRPIGSHTSSEATKVKGSAKGRLQRRTSRIWKQDYLHYRYLWPNLEWAARTALEHIGSDCPKVLDIGCGHKPYGDLFSTAPMKIHLRLHLRTHLAPFLFATTVVEYLEMSAGTEEPRS
jgi:hypothetical protein